MCQLSPVTFHGDTIFCIDYENQPFTPAKPIVENLGLGWASQSQKLNANKERWGITIIVIPSESGDQQTLCLPVRKLPAYLASINPKKVREELRPKIELYQAESDDALWNYWMNGRAERPVIENGSITPSHRSELKAIVDAKLSTYPASVQGKARSEIWSRFNRNFKIAEYAQLPAKRMAEARDYLIELEVKALKKLPAADAYALPTPEPRFPLYRNGRFYPPHYKRKHAPGPRETGLMDFWNNEYNPRVAELEDKFRALMDGLDAALGNLYPHAVADLGRDADTMFSVSCVLEGMYAARDMAQTSFKEALSKTRLHMRMATSVAVALGQ